MNNNVNNNINFIPNISNNMNMIPNMNMMPNMNNNINFFPNMNINQIDNNNMNFNPNMNMNINLNQMNENVNIMQQMQMMQQMPQIQVQMQDMNLNNDSIKEKQEKIKKNIDNYYISKLYEIDFKRIESQNQHFKNIKDKLMNHIRSLELRIEENNKIMSKYLEEANNIMNYKNLLNFSISIEDIYEDKLNELLLCVNEITDLYHIRVKELKNNYLNDFNKRYNFHIVDQGNIGFRHSDLLNLRLDQIKFNELCRINFKNIVELELKFSR